jgi:ABC-2 type transport system ATP-binding protein
VHKPALLILDEPTSGLDPVQIVEMRQLIRNLRGAHTILLSSHILSEISQTCDRLLVIQEGEIVAQGTEAELASRMGAHSSVELEVRAPAPRALDVLRAVDGVSEADLVRQEGEVAVLRVATLADIRPQLVKALVVADLDVLRVDRGAAKLESIFLSLTRSKEAS